LARKPNSFCLFYEWCVNPLDCIIRWLWSVWCLSRCLCFGFALGLSTFVYFFPVAGGVRLVLSPRCNTFLLYICFPLLFQKKNLICCLTSLNTS
jgi:hypothetical protein